MKRFLFIACIGLATSAFAPAQTSSDQNISLQQEIMKLEQEKDRAHQQGDRSTLERLYSDDFVIVNARGEISNKRNLIESYTSRGSIFKSYTSDEIRIRILGDAVIVMGRRRFRYDKSKMTAEGSYDARYTNVYAKRQGGWQIVASQFTLIDK